MALGNATYLRRAVCVGLACRAASGPQTVPGLCPSGVTQAQVTPSSGQLLRVQVTACSGQLLPVLALQGLEAAGLSHIPC